MVRRLLLTVGVIALGCGGNSGGFAGGGLGGVAGGGGAAGDGGAIGGAGGAAGARPGVVTGSRVFDGTATMLFNGPSCAEEVGASGDRW